MLYPPECVSLEDRHEFLALELREDNRLADHASVGEEDIEPSILSKGFIDDGLDTRLIRSIKASSMNLNVREGRS